MAANGLDVFAGALWTARNKADPTQDQLAKHLMLQEIEDLKDEARGVADEVYSEGFAMVRRDLYPDTIQLVLKDALKLFRDPDIAAWMGDCLKRLYVGALKSSERNLDNPMIRSLLATGLIHQAEKRRPGATVDKHVIDKQVSAICGHLQTSGFAIIPKDPAADLLESALQRDQRGSKLALVFGDDPENIAGLYRQMVARQRVG
ncbi:MAG: hypothetical protein JO021_14310 [Alphaproteobacteria bacterium]|nr:hypothetical protein [Alphaproteobacteria bacterium]